MNQYFAKLRPRFEVFKTWNHWTLLSLALLVSLVLYLLGLRFLLVPCLAIFGAYYLPLPDVFRSRLSRFVVSFIFVSCLLPLLGLVQHALAKYTGFAGVALLLSLSMYAALFVLMRPIERRPLFASEDLFAALTGLVVVIPFASIFIGHDSLAQILQLAGSQVVDAGNHFSAIGHYQYNQLMPAGGYPSGFEYGTAFFQHTLYAEPVAVGWRMNDIVYFLEYIVVAIIFGYVAYYASHHTLARLKRTGVTWQHQFVLAACLAPVLLVVYTLPFMAEGFLNYYYAIIVVLLGFLALADASDRGIRANTLAVCMFLIFTFGASSSWTLFVPLMLIIAALHILPTALSRTWHRDVLRVNNIPVGILLLFHAVLIYLQLRSLDIGSEAGINADGNLHNFRYLMLLAGLSAVAWLMYSNRVSREVRRHVSNTIVPAYLFVGCLCLMQFFSVGAVRYYAIKTGMLVEVVTLCLVAPMVVWLASQATYRSWKTWLMLPFGLITVVTLLLGPIANPLGDMRQIFRPVSGIDKPVTFEDDAQAFVRLGTANLIKHSNTMALHFNPETQKFDGPAQMSYVANLMQRNDTPQDAKAITCNDRIYDRLTYGTGTEADEALIRNQLPKCAAKAAQKHVKYYIITDRASEPYIREAFGTTPNVVIRHE